MKSVYLPLLPLPALAVLVAVSACSKPRSEETTHLIPPPVSIIAPAAHARTPAPAVAAALPDEEKPTPEEVKEFERPVRK